MTTIGKTLDNITFATDEDKFTTISKINKISPQLATKDIIKELYVGSTRIDILSWYLDLINNILDKFDANDNNFNLTDNELNLLASFTISLTLSRCGRSENQLINTEIVDNARDYFILIYLSDPNYKIDEELKALFLPFIADVVKNIFNNFNIPTALTINSFAEKDTRIISKFSNPMDIILEKYSEMNGAEMLSLTWNTIWEDIYPKWYGHEKYIDSVALTERINYNLSLLPYVDTLNVNEPAPNEIILPPKVNYEYAQHKLHQEIEFRAHLLSEEDPTRSADENWYLAEKRVKIEHEYWSIDKKLNENYWENKRLIRTRAEELYLDDETRSADENWYLAEKQIKEEYMMAHNAYFIQAMKYIKYSFSNQCFGSIRDEYDFNIALTYLKYLSDNNNYMASFELAKYYYHNTYCAVEFGISYKYFLRAVEQGHWPSRQAWKEFIKKEITCN